jgi:hypothetical protein
MWRSIQGVVVLGQPRQQQVQSLRPNGDLRGGAILAERLAP